MDAENDEAALDRLGELQDQLDEIVLLSGERDGENYSKDFKVRARKIGGRYYLALYWYRFNRPSNSVIYAPPGSWLGNWYKSTDRNGDVVWESGLECLDA